MSRRPERRSTFGPSHLVGAEVDRSGGRWDVPKTWFVVRTAVGKSRRRPSRWVPKGRAYFYVLTAGWKFGMCSVARKGICAVARWRRDEALTPFHLAPWHTEYPSMKKKSKPAETGGVKHLAALESNLFGPLLSLVEHCAVRSYDDGDPREPGWFTVKTSGAAWVVQVKDPDACVSFSAVADTLDKALETAALLLSCDEAPWELDAFLSKMKAEKKKK